MITPTSNVKIFLIFNNAIKVVVVVVAESLQAPEDDSQQR